MVHIHQQESQALCPACELGPFIRNHYFTGKLLLERDFSDETRFHMEKLRHHHQRLHGWGVVCGLKVKQHPHVDCQDRFICVEPGTAIDCCGHEIVVREEECSIDITKLASIKELIKKEDKERHVLQVCLRYRECPTEEIPVLYDECGCDETQCAPNRILESYNIDVLVDPPAPPSPHSLRLEWKNNFLSSAPVSRVALHDASHRIYVLVGNNVHQVNTETAATVASQQLQAEGLEVAVSNNGEHLFVVTEPPADPVNPRQLVVLKTSDMSIVRTLDIENSVNSDVRLAVALEPDNRLMALIRTPGNVLIWETDLTGAASPASPARVALAPDLQSVAIASDAKHAYAVGPSSHTIKRLDSVTKTVSPELTILPAAAQPTVVAVVRSSGPDLLVVADQAGKKIYLVGLNPLTSKEAPLAHEPIALATSPGGRWAYVLEKDGDKSFVQVVDLHRLQQGLSVDPGEPLQVGDGSQQLVLSASGAHLYIPYLGVTIRETGGGVAKVEINEEVCEELLWRHLEGCPRCDTPNCVVLATIERYRVGDKIEDMKDPPTKAAEDEAAKVARINNRKGRQLLPSTHVLTELIKCLLQRGPGGPGPQGPQGPQGLQGPQGNPGVGERGPAGPGLEEGLVQIKALSWRHGDSTHDLLQLITRVDGSKNYGVVIGFTGDVVVSRAIDAEHVFEVSIPHAPGENERLGLLCRCPIRGRIIPVDYSDDTHGFITSATETPGPNARGVAFLFELRATATISNILVGEIKDLWIRLRGDFVRDATREGRAIDAEFVRATLPTGDRPSGSPYGVQGGLFESWFRVGRVISPNPIPDRINLNRANRSALEAVTGISGSMADRILSSRRTGLFRDLDDFRTRINPSDQEWELIKNEITVTPPEE